MASLLRRFLDNHVLANLSFVLVLGLGLQAYLAMPRAKDPEVNFNWVSIITVYPGASAEDVEHRITDPLEDAIRRSVRDMRFVSSTSREHVSNILVRFNQIDPRSFDKRVADLRREVQNTYTEELPTEAEDPLIYEIGSSNAFPTATVVVTSPGDDENLRRETISVKKDLERIPGVDRVDGLGLPDPELHVAFYPRRLQGLGITAADLGNTVRAYFRDVSAGDIQTRDGQWIVRLKGTSADPGALADYPVMTAKGVVPLGSLADIYRSTEEPGEMVRFKGRPAALLTVVKLPDSNVLDLLARIDGFIAARNRLVGDTGVRLQLVDDQTLSTRHALSLMENNALIGLGFVLFITWLFLGTRIALVTSVGIPFTLAGTFIVIRMLGYSVNNAVLLGVVISLGMIVDDAVVVVESMYQRLQRGVAGMRAALESLREVFAPVTTSVLTTVAAFLPLMLLPGLLGDYLKVIPIVVTTALLVSLSEAYWMLPAHVIAMRITYRERNRLQLWRENFTRLVRLRYTQLLLKALRHPVVSVAGIVLVLVLALGAVLGGRIHYNFFESDAMRLFYVNVEMPAGSTLEQTSAMLQQVQKRVLAEVRPDELRAAVTYAGRRFTQTEPLFGDTMGQIMVSLQPQHAGGRHVYAIADAVEQALRRMHTPASLSLLRMKDGPPTGRPISVKVRGDDLQEIKAAADYLKGYLDRNPLFSNASLDYRPGNPVLALHLDGEAIQRAGLNPAVVTRMVQAYVDGDVVTDFQDNNEKVKVRVIAKNRGWSDIQDLLRQDVSLPDGRAMALGDLVRADYGYGQSGIKHYNFKRIITLEADIDEAHTDTVQANNLIRQEWARVQGRYPDVNLDFTGMLDDIQETIDSIWGLFLFGVGVIYIILGTQFRSYWQPLMILITVPLAFTGVILGLLVTGNPLSLYTMYGVVALAGIAVNSAIVLISAANDRLAAGMSVLHATVYAARRRVIPILITSLTTIGGLFSLAAGLAGQSLVWGPVATAIVWGLSFSTVLTLIVIPLLYRAGMGRRRRQGA